MKFNKQIMKIVCKLLFFIFYFCTAFADADLFTLGDKSNPLVLEATLPKDSHLYWKYPGELGKPLELDFSQSSNLLHHHVFWPWPQTYVFEGQTSYVFGQQIELPIFISPIDDLKPVDLKIKISGSICSDSACELYSQTIQRVLHPQLKALKTGNNFTILESSLSRDGSLNVKAKFQYSVKDPEFILGIGALAFTPSFKQQDSDTWLLRWNLDEQTIRKFSGSDVELFCDKAPLSQSFKLVGDESSLHMFVSIIIFSLLGGLVLNFMPCILPVLSLKLLSLTKQNGKTSTILYILGIAATFNVIAISSICLKHFGQSFGFGMQFQNPSFIILMSIVMVVLISHSLERMELNFSSSITDKLNGVNIQKGYLFDFASGVIAAVLSTSCAAPLLSVAIGFAVTSSAAINLAIFNLIAIGFSAPYILILFYPKVINFIPKSGPWLNVLKKAISILLILTLAWLLFVLYGQIGLRALAGVFGVLILIKLVIESREQILYKPWIRLSLFAALCASCFYFPLQASYQDDLYNKHKASLWQDFSQQALDDALAKNKVVLVDVTADWCGTCQYNKIVVLDRSWTVALLARHGVVALRASLNSHNPYAVEFMKSHGAYAIPLNIVYGPKAPEGIRLPTTYSYSELERAIVSAQ